MLRKKDVQQSGQKKVAMRNINLNMKIKPPTREDKS